MTESTNVVQGEESATSWFTTYTVFARKDDAAAKSDADTTRDSQEFATLVETLQANGVTVRGLYDVSGMRAEADIMVWMWSKSPEALQEAIRQIRRAGLFSTTTVAFTAMGADRMAEFNPEHVPAITEGRKPRKWLCFYPFVRSYDWYLLP
ncbi:MAG: chlorite dismutase family protein, partial [Yaniella sp.]|nr:chlorite dismutase family protein [Yaniella sp.]